MGHKVCCCCSIRNGVIVIGALSIVSGLLGLGALCGVGYHLTSTLLASRPPPAPTPAPDTEFIRVPRHQPMRRIETFSEMRVEVMDSPSTPLTDLNSGNQRTNKDASIETQPQTHLLKKNDSATNEAPTPDGGQQTEEPSQGTESETRSSAKDPPAESALEPNAGGEQPSDEARPVTSSSTTPLNTQTSAEGTEGLMTSRREAPLPVSTTPTAASTNRAESSEVMERDAEKWGETASSCGGPELEELLWKISIVTAYETAQESSRASRGTEVVASLRTALFSLAMLLLYASAFLEVLHSGAGVLLIAGTLQRRPGLLRPWRFLALATWALAVGLQAMTFAVMLPLKDRARDPDNRGYTKDTFTLIVLLIWLAVYMYFYWVVLTFERQLRKEKQEKYKDNNKPVDKQEGKIYSCRF